MWYEFKEVSDIVFVCYYIVCFIYDCGCFDCWDLLVKLVNGRFWMVFLVRCFWKNYWGI